MAGKRKYPVGIQSFESIRKDGYVYVDKTPIIYKMITKSGHHFFFDRAEYHGMENGRRLKIEIYNS